jgi:small subunit ribosomal protein S3
MIQGVDSRSVDLSINNLQKKRVSFTIDKNLSNIEYSISKFVQLNSYEVSILPLKMKSRFQSAPLICEYICQKLQENIGFRQIFKQLCQEMKNESLMPPLRGLPGKNSFKPNEEIQGMRILCAGRLNGVEMARVEFKKLGQTSLHVFSSKIDYGSSNAYTLQGLLGVKVWLCYR